MREIVIALNRLIIIEYLIITMMGQWTIVKKGKRTDEYKGCESS